MLMQQVAEELRLIVDGPDEDFRDALKRLIADIEHAATVMAEPPADDSNLDTTGETNA